MPAVVLCTLLAACTPAPDAGEVAEDVTPTEAAASEGRASADGERVGPTVVFLGTSLTAGLGLANDEDTYVARVDELADSAGLPIHAVNAGVSGETSAGGLRRLDWVLREPLDVLVLELGANDGLRGQDPFALQTNLRTIIERTRTRYPGAAVVIAGMEAPPNLGPDYTQLFRSVFEELAASTGSELIPFLLDGVAGVPELNQSDRIHPTADGHRVIAHNVWVTLEPVVRALAER